MGGWVGGCHCSVSHSMFGKMIVFFLFFVFFLREKQLCLGRSEQEQFCFLSSSSCCCHLLTLTPSPPLFLSLFFALLLINPPSLASFHSCLGLPRLQHSLFIPQPLPCLCLPPSPDSGSVLLARLPMCLSVCQREISTGGERVT